MPQIIISTDFKFAENGIYVIEYVAGPDPVEVSVECAEVAIAEAWATLADGKPKRSAKTKAPETAAAEFAPEVA